MHRVELKAVCDEFLALQSVVVPNAPCGVESLERANNSPCVISFLMHRVELKVGLS